LATINKQSGKRGTSYRVRVRKLNSPTVTKTFSSRSFAEKWARKTELAIEVGIYFDQDEPRKHTVGEPVDRYIEEDLQKLSESDWRVRNQQLNWWQEQIGKLTLNRVTPALLEIQSKVRKINNLFVFPGRLHTHADFPRAGWISATEKANLEDFKFHDCRHSAASELAMNGASLHKIAAVLGHKTLAMVQRYAHLS